MDEDILKSLKGTPPPRASDVARQRAIDAAMAAFDAAQEKVHEKSYKTVQGNSLIARLRSIASDYTRNWTMDIRIPLGTTFAALLILPLGWHFLNQTALTPVGMSVPPLAIDDVDTQVSAQPEVARQHVEIQSPIIRENFATAGHPPVVEIAPTPAPLPMATRQSTQTLSVGGAPSPAVMPAPSGDTFTSFQEGGTKFTAQEPVSTFSIDVDTAAYAYARRMLEMGIMPQPDAVRVEELINYFSYDYALPEEGGAPFVPTIAVHPTPWNTESRLVHIGIRGEAVGIEALPPANLVLLIDTSGSMDQPDRLPLLKRAFALLVNELGAEDTVSIVTYAGSAGVALEPTKGSEKARILAALDSLVPGGSTAGARGIEQAYALAEQAMIADGTNRVLLATDGDFNVGISDPKALEDLIENKRDAGIFLSVLGFGMGNYNDAIMQALAQAGNGNAAYIDSYSEARKVLVEEMGGTLVTIAKDVKIQVEFNPEMVSEYRLIGYETRALNREDFNNDAVDAGDVGAGHTVTAIYEIVPVGARGSVDPLRYGDAIPAVPGNAEEYGFLKIRYKSPQSEISQLLEAPIPVGDVHETLADMPDDMRFATAVAAFGQKLRGSTHLRSMSWEDIRVLAQGARGIDETGRRAEFIRLIDIAASLSN